jgi:hypothetical protein
MSAELLPAEENEQGPAEETRTLSERDRYFAMRIALGDSIRAASRTIGVTDRHGRRLVKQPQIEDAIRQYAAEAVDSARRVIVGKVRWAARRMVQLASPGGSQHKGANVEFAALKYILDVNRVSEIQVGGTQSRILTFIPATSGTCPKTWPIPSRLLRRSIGRIPCPSSRHPTDYRPTSRARRVSGTVAMPNQLRAVSPPI